MRVGSRACPGRVRTALSREWMRLAVSGLLAAIAVLSVIGSAAAVAANADRQTVEAVQIALALCGYDCGPIDGRMGPRTIAAIRAFEADRNSIAEARAELVDRTTAVLALTRAKFSRWDFVGEPTRDKLVPPGDPRADSSGFSISPQLSTQPTPHIGHQGTAYPPAVAENGDIRGVDNDGDGRSEPVYVRGYIRKDGTYVRGHYRARPRRR